MSNSGGVIQYCALEIGATPRMTLIENFITLSGVSPDISLNTSGNLFHIGTPFFWSSMVARFNWFPLLVNLCSLMNWNYSWCGILKFTFLPLQSITVWYLLSHVIPSITSYPLVFITSMSASNFLSHNYTVHALQTLLVEITLFPVLISHWSWIHTRVYHVMQQIY